MSSTGDEKRESVVNNREDPTLKERGNVSSVTPGLSFSPNEFRGVVTLRQGPDVRTEGQGLRSEKVLGFWEV